MPTKLPLLCPMCASRNLKSIGSNGIEPDAGYTCQDCSQTLRKRGSAWFYIFMLVLGLVIWPVGIGFLIFGGIAFSVRLLLMGGIAFVGGLVCFVYAVRRLTKPVPLLERPYLDYRPPPRPRPEPEPKPVAQPTPVEPPPPALPVWRVSGILNQTGLAVESDIEAESDLDAATVAELNGVTVTQVQQVS